MSTVCRKDSTCREKLSRKEIYIMKKLITIIAVIAFSAAVASFVTKLFETKMTKYYKVY